MKKKLSCRAMGLNCDFVVVDESEEAITGKIGDHVKTVHNIEFTEELLRRARDLIRLEAA